MTDSPEVPSEPKQADQKPKRIPASPVIRGSDIDPKDQRVGRTVRPYTLDHYDNANPNADPTGHEEDRTDEGRTNEDDN